MSLDSHRRKKGDYGSWNLFEIARIIWKVDPILQRDKSFRENDNGKSSRELGRSLGEIWNLEDAHWRGSTRSGIGRTGNQKGYNLIDPKTRRTNSVFSGGQNHSAAPSDSKPHRQRFASSDRFRRKRGVKSNPGEHRRVSILKQPLRQLWKKCICIYLCSLISTLVQQHTFFSLKHFCDESILLPQLLVLSDRSSFSSCVKLILIDLNKASKICNWKKRFNWSFN